MGLLSKAWNAVDPFLPDEQIMGLLGRLGGGGQRMAAPPPQVPQGSVDQRLDALLAAPRQPPQQQRGGPSKFDYVADFLVRGMTPNQVRGESQRADMANLSAQMKLKQFVEQQKALAAFRGRYAGGGGAPQPGGPSGAPGGAPGPGMPGLRDMGPDLMALSLAGYDTSDLLAIADKSQPTLTALNNTMVDTRDPRNANRTVPKVGDGQVVLYDANQNPVAVRDLDGNIKSIAEHAGATTNAQEAARAQYDLVAVPQSDGSTRMMPRSQAIGALGGGGGGGPMRSPGGPALGVSQNPAQAKVAEAGAQAQIDLPRVQGNAQQALSVIHQMRTSPALKDRTGWHAVLPAIPGTAGANFDAMADQLKGKVFLEAFQSLKGAGQITEIEGKKATDAIARLDRSQTPEAYDAALAELEDVIQSGLDRATAAASQGPGAARGGSRGGSIPTLSEIDAAIDRAKRRGR